MLDASGRFEVDGIAVFPDGTSPSGFYAVSLAPRLASDEDGRPTVSLAVYGSRSAGVFSAAGAVLTLTTELALSAAELSRLNRMLAARLAAGRPAESTEPPPQPELLAPEWVEASVEVRLTKELVLTGTPSMGAQNRCSFSTKLTAEGAAALVRAWRAGLPDAQIVYQGRLRSGAGGGGRFAGGSSAGTSVSRSRVTSSTTRTTTTHRSSSTSSSSGGDDSDNAGEPTVTTSETHSSTSWTSGDPTRAADCDDTASSPEPAPTVRPTARPDADRIAATARLRDSLPDPSDNLLITEI